MKRIFLILFIVNIFFACTDVLDKVPLDEVTEKTYWTTSTDVELYINRFYTNFRGTTIQRYSSYENNSDNLQPLSPNDLLNGTRSVPATGGGWNWDDIRRINYFLENVDRVTEGIPSELNQYKGEGYFFRAFLYFEKVQRFGDVPWYGNVLTIDSDELYAARDPRNEIVDHIIEDLDAAIALLQGKDQIGATRINLESALLFKSRVCLYEGTWEKYHAGTVFGVDGSDGERYLQLAAETAGQLIDEGNIELYSTGDPDNDYWGLFSQDDLADADIDEALLIESKDPDQALGHWAWTYLNGTRGQGTGMTKSFVESYLAKDGLPISLSPLYQGDNTLNEVVIGRDPRLMQSMWVPGQVSIASTPPQIFEYPPLHKGASDMSTTGYMVRKGSTTDPEQNTGSSTDNYGSVDGMVFRYAEVLLNFAEAKAELGTLTQSDLDKSINLIRERVGMPDLTMDVGYTDPEWNFPELSPIINEIRRERRVELALEGYRNDDLMRWAAAELIQGKRWKGARFILGESFPQIEDQISEIPVDQNRYIDRYQNTLPSGLGFNDQRDYLFPIPTNELTLNSNLTQNPGW